MKDVFRRGSSLKVYTSAAISKKYLKKVKEVENLSSYFNSLSSVKTTVLV